MDSRKPGLTHHADGEKRAADCIGKGLPQEGRDEEWTWGFGSDWNASSIVDETSDLRGKREERR